MRVRTVTLANYRNYEQQSIEASPSVNIFLGRNAQGKTNILEGIWYAALGRSHRARTDAELIRWNEAAGRLSLETERRGVKYALEFRFFRNRRRQIFLGGQPIPTRDLIGTLNVVLFSPEDLLFVNGAPEGRRRFLNMELSQADATYFYDLAVYTRLLSQRNALLKRLRERGGRPEELQPWDVQLAEKAVRVVQKRQEAVKKLSDLAGEVHQRLTGGEEKLTIEYRRHGPDEVAEALLSWYNNTLRDSAAADIRRGSTGVGPHLDDLILKVNGAELRAYGSQGQQRTGVLSLKLAELEFLRKATGEYPVLLLDDVMSELDGGRRKELLSFLQRENIQTFITATDAAYFPAAIPGTVFTVEKGTIREAAAGNGHEREESEEF